MDKKLRDMTLNDMVENCYYCNNDADLLESDDHCKGCIFMNVCGSIPEDFREYIDSDTKHKIDKQSCSINPSSINITCENVYITENGLGSGKKNGIK